MTCIGGLHIGLNYQAYPMIKDLKHILWLSISMLNEELEHYDDELNYKGDGND